MDNSVFKKAKVSGWLRQVFKWDRGEVKKVVAETVHIAMILIAAAALTFAISRCGFISEDSSSPAPEDTVPGPSVAPAAPSPSVSPVAKAESKTPSLTATVVPGSEANVYSVNLSWSASTGEAKAVVIKRKDSQGHALQLDLLTPQTAAYSDLGVTAGEPYTYEVMALSNEKLTSLASTDVVIPKDFQVTGSVELTAIGHEFNRLFMENDSAILTYGQDLSIDVSEIVAKSGAKIDTSPREPSAPLNVPGASGGFLHVKAQAATGTLYILAAGQNGGAGLKGAQGATGGPGGRGNDGAADYNSECWSVAIMKHFTPSLREGPGHCSKNWYCKQQTGDGAPGAQGGRGDMGTTGQPGGMSAKVLVEVTSPQDFQVSFDAVPGRGGAGGPGGDGGIGGPGGDPGSQDSHSQCRVANRGPQGPRGPQGTTGLPGPDGAPAPVCLRLGSASSGDCQGF